ncbi:hypothetical protein ACU4GD_38140 [Cupriavidus basilensis]
MRTAVAERGRRHGPQTAWQPLREGHAAISELPAADRLVPIMAASDVLLTEATVPPPAPARPAGAAEPGRGSAGHRRPPLPYRRWPRP